MSILHSRTKIVIMPVYRRIYTFNIFLHITLLIMLNHHPVYIYSVFLSVLQTATLTETIVKINYCKPVVEHSKAARSNSQFTLVCLLFLSIVDFFAWFSILLLRSGDIQPNPGPVSVSSSSSSSSSSTFSSTHLHFFNLNHSLSFVQYNVQSVINKLDILNAELFEFDVISLTETWLNSTIPTDDLLLHSYSKPERKDRTGDTHGGVMIYVKEGIYYKRRHD